MNTDSERRSLECGLIVELLSPRLDSEKLDQDLETFASRYQMLLDHGLVVSVPDNPMGALRFHVTEVAKELGLEVPPGQVLVHLNTFHTKDNLDQILDAAAGIGARNLLVISGDGSERLPRVKPEAIGVEGEVVTSVELLGYIRRRYEGRFSLGVAFNPYEPQDHELEKMRRKVDAGAQYIITQPVLGYDERIDRLREKFDVPVFLGGWMSKRLDLLSECVGYAIPAGTPYDPVANLDVLWDRYPGSGLYLSMVGFKTQIQTVVDWYRTREMEGKGCDCCCGCED